MEPANPALIDVSSILRANEILITGANGFLGKVVLALLIDRFPEFRHLHLVMRARRGASPRERFDRDVLGAPCLKPVVERADPDVVRHRISVLAGDVGDPLCGLTPEVIDGLRGRVGVIVNIAGLVEFTPPIDESLRSNVDGVENVVALARRLGARLVHVSTCFVCGESDGLVEEDEPILGFYPRRRNLEDQSFRVHDEIRFLRDRIRDVYAEAGARGTSDRETKQKLMDLGVQRAAQWGWVNTYTYTKSIGEQLIASETGLEFAIVRPAIVEAALEFPFPGWVEGGRTAAPLVIMAMRGLRHWPIREHAPMEVVPVDQVASAIVIITAALLAGHAQPVYHLATADRNPVTFGQIVRWIRHEFRRETGRSRLRAPGVRVLPPARAKARGQTLIRRLNTLHEAATAVRQFAQRNNLPGHRALARFGSSLRMLTRQLSIREATLELYQPFMHDNRFVFESENIRRARQLLSPAEQGLLPWAPESIDWRRFWTVNELRGIQTWVEGEATKAHSFKM